MRVWDNDQIVELLLVETNNQGGKDKVAGLDVTAYRMSDDHKRELSLRIKDKAQIKIEEGMPAVSLRQTGKVNVFYTDTTHVTSYDAVSMGLVEVSSAASIESVRWVAGQDTESGANTEFVIDRYSTYVVKNGKYTKKYMIQQHKPILNSNKKPSDAAVKGNVYIRLSGYNEEVRMPFTIQTVYKKPKLKVADYKVCPALGEVTDDQYIYTNAAKNNNYLLKRVSTVWRGYSDVTCADEEIEVVENSNVALSYSGTKDKKTQLTVYSDYWYESLTVPVKVKVAKSKVKLAPATVTLNTAYPSETTQTAAATGVYNAATGTYVNMSDVRIEGANAQAQQILDQSLINRRR